MNKQQQNDQIRTDSNLGHLEGGVKYILLANTLLLFKHKQMFNSHRGFLRYAMHHQYDKETIKLTYYTNETKNQR